jgi:hypothetical protein
MLFFVSGQSDLFEIKKHAISSSKFNEFSISFIDSHAYCISDNIRVGLNRKEDILGNSLFDILAYENAKKKFKRTSTQLTKLVNTPLNEGGFCSFDSTFYFTRNLIETKNGEQQQLNIFVTHLKDNGDWTEPEALFETDK